MAPDARPLVAHVLFRFDTGGLENGVVNLINHMPPERFRHAVVALTEVTDFRLRVQRDDVEYVALRKPPGHGLWQFPKLYRLFRRLRPQIVHSRNLAALEAQVPAWAAGVPVRIHGEHGWDANDPDGSNPVYQRVRRLYRPFVHHYLALSRESQAYLRREVHVPEADVTQVYNGVDTARFQPGGETQRLSGCPFDPARHWIVGTVGRMQTVKDQPMLARAFVSALGQAPELRERLRLVMVGDGPLHAQAQAVLREGGVAELAWLPGARSDVPEIMRSLHLFVLPSQAEGISNTILEAMACGVPVLATDVGGNADLMEPGVTGELTPARDPQALATRLVALAADPVRARAMGLAGRARVERRFSIAAMVSAYVNVYDRQLSRHPAMHTRSP